MEELSEMKKLKMSNFLIDDVNPSIQQYTLGSS